MNTEDLATIKQQAQKRQTYLEDQRRRFKERYARIGKDESFVKRYRILCRKNFDEELYSILNATNTDYSEKRRLIQIYNNEKKIKQIKKQTECLLSENRAFVM